VRRAGRATRWLGDLGLIIVSGTRWSTQLLLRSKLDSSLYRSIIFYFFFNIIRSKHNRSVYSISFIINLRYRAVAGTRCPNSRGNYAIESRRSSSWVPMDWSLSSTVIKRRGGMRWVLVYEVPRPVVYISP